MHTRKVINVALKAGELLLKSGAEIYRVEETINRICQSYHVDCESFVLPTGIFISTTGDVSDSSAVTKRVRERAVNLEIIEKVNSLSRRMHKEMLSLEKAEEVLHTIETGKRYPFLIRLVSAGISSLMFTLIFNGTFGEGMAAFIVSILIYLIQEKISQTGLFQFFEFFISGMIAAAGALVAVKLVEALNLFRIIIGSIIVLLPGVAITNGIKDALNGDIVSSMSRIGEAVYITAAIGVGVLLILYFGLRWVT